MTPKEYFDQEKCPLSEDELLDLQESQIGETVRIRYKKSVYECIDVPAEHSHEDVDEEVIAEWIRKWHDDAEDIEIYDINV